MAKQFTSSSLRGAAGKQTNREVGMKFKDIPVEVQIVAASALKELIVTDSDLNNFEGLGAEINKVFLALYRETSDVKPDEGRAGSNFGSEMTKFRPVKGVNAVMIALEKEFADVLARDKTGESDFLTFSKAALASTTAALEGVG